MYWLAGPCACRVDRLYVACWPTIHVERFNPALRLYERLGFRRAADKDAYFLMERSPESYSPPH